MGNGNGGRDRKEVLKGKRMRKENNKPKEETNGRKAIHKGP